MSGSSVTAQRPVPHADRVPFHESFFALFGGPIAWFLQLCGGYALASPACFIQGDRSWLPTIGSQWTWPAMLTLMLTAVMVALLALAMSWRAYRPRHDKVRGDVAFPTEVGAGRTRFLALWGMVLGAGFACATALTTIAFALLPRCGD